MRRTIVGLLSLALPCTALAAKDDDPFGDDEDEPVFEDEAEPEPEPVPEKPPAPAPKPAPDAKKGTKAEPAPKPPPPPDPEASDDGEDDDELRFDDEPADPTAPEDALDLDEEEATPTVEPQAPGADSTVIYRKQLAEVEGTPADEEVMAWEDYLERYPNSLFRSQIEARMDELLSGQFRERLRETGGRVDAADQELPGLQPINLPDLNPRTRLTAQLAIGFGAEKLYTGGIVDFQYAVLRNLAVHGGLDGTYTGWGLNAGVRYAFVKSVRDRVIATVGADARVNLSGGVFFQARPYLGVQASFGPATLLVTGGAAIGTRPHETVGVTGGLHLAIRLAPPVGLFAESDFYLRNLGHQNLLEETSPYAFETVTVGLRFYPKLKTRTDADPLQLSASGQVGVVANYIQPYQGAVDLQGTYYLKSTPLKAKKKAKKAAR